MGDEGLEQTDVTDNDDKGLGNQPIPRAANALHFSPELPEIDAELACVIEAWPTLGDEAKRAVLATIAADAG